MKRFVQKGMIQILGNGNSPSGGTGDSSGGSTLVAREKEVNFRDYDGTILYSYTVEEAAKLKELPPLPTQEGLVCQGWNYTLDEIKEAGNELNVGAMYITDDGKTRIYITLNDEYKSPALILTSLTRSNVIIDWGDNSTNTITITASSYTKHDYAAAGDYVITITVESGEITLNHDSGTGWCHSILTNSSGSSDSINKTYGLAIKRVEIGSGVTGIGTHAFYQCQNLTNVTIPAGVTTIGENAFYEDYILSNLIIPAGVTSVGKYAFRDCRNLKSLIISPTVINIEQYAFLNCYCPGICVPPNITTIGSCAFMQCGITSVIIPAGVTSIGTYAFYQCYFVRCYDFTKCTSVPTLEGTNAFSGNFSFKILVPATLVDEWKAATNWSTLAKNIVGV